jgi:hypothetical protein
VGHQCPGVALGASVGEPLSALKGVAGPYLLRFVGHAGRSGRASTNGSVPHWLHVVTMSTHS